MNENTNSMNSSSEVLTANVKYQFKYSAFRHLYVLKAPGPVYVKLEGGGWLGPLMAPRGIEGLDVPDGLGWIYCTVSGEVVLGISSGPRIVGGASGQDLDTTLPADENKVCGFYTQGENLPNLKGVRAVLAGMVGTAADGTKHVYPMKTRANGAGYIPNAEALEVIPATLTLAPLPLGTVHGFEELAHGARYLAVEVQGTATGNGVLSVHGGQLATITPTTHNQLFVYDRAGARLALDRMTTLPGRLFYVLVAGYERFKFNVIAPDTTVAANLYCVARYDRIPNNAEG